MIERQSHRIYLHAPGGSRCSAKSSIASQQAAWKFAKKAWLV
jgi:uncharacterized membrane protein